MIYDDDTILIDGINILDKEKRQTLYNEFSKRCSDIEQELTESKDNHFGNMTKEQLLAIYNGYKQATNILKRQ